MTNVTLIMSRTPVAEFKNNGRSGRWGAMVVVKGAKIASVAFSDQANGNSGGIQLAGRTLDLQTADGNGGGGLDVIAEFDTMERFKADSGKGFYMQVKPRRAQPYLLTMYKAGLVAKLNKTGYCLKVHGHGYKQQGSGNDAGILIHEAPHVGWLIGCVAPRETNNREQFQSEQPSRRAVEKIFEAMGGFSLGRKADLFVMDW